MDRTTNRSDYDAKSSMGEHHDKITFDEHVYALYADFKHPLSDKWNLRTGLRMEYTHTSGENNGRRLEHIKSYLNRLPHALLGIQPQRPPCLQPQWYCPPQSPPLRPTLAVR